MYKAITFDLWGTLIKSNPQYKEKRNNLILSYNPSLTLEEIEQAISIVKKSYDENVEKFGIQYNRFHVYDTIFKRLNIELNSMQIQFFIHNCNQLFIEHHPYLYHDDIPEILSKLNEKYELHLISNTVLVYGEELKEIMKVLGIYKYFKSFTFSDRVGYSKPNYNIFKDAHEKIHFLKEEIIHIGDNDKTDEYGAKTYGFNCILVNGKYDNIINRVKNNFNI